ncbi:MAG: rhomboid family intramembrane serine protease [Ignavibacteria bacterium]|nr:rhomboid family intramembrane serine protease [Ignavibacteria bacterium]
MGLESRDYYRPSGFRGFTFFPPIIKNLLIINVGVFVLQMIFDNIVFGGLPGWYVLNRYFALNPISGIDAAGFEYNFQIWQLLTYQFMHGDFTHILFNMFMLWMFGMELENLMSSKKFLIFYLVCGFGAGLAQLLLSPIFSDTLAPTIGASGAVFGVMLAFAMYFPDRYILIYFLIPIKAKYLIAILMVFEFLSIREPSIVAHLAHIGGAVTGLIFLLTDKRNTFNFQNLIKNFTKQNTFGSSNYGKTWGKRSVKTDDIEDAKFYDIDNSKKNEDNYDQEEIDRILDKISQSGYKNLTEREKRILFDASKKK